MNKPKISGVFLYLLGLGVVLLLFYYLALSPMTAQTQKLTLEHNQITAQLAQYDGSLQRTAELKSKISAMQTEINNRGSSTGVTIKNVAEDMEAACSQLELVPENVQIGEETADKSKLSSTGQPLCSTSVILQVNCTDKQLQELLGYFESKSKGAYYVNQVVRANVSEDQHSAQITMTLYYFGSVPAK